jgi:hypothetical protein
VTSLAGLLSQGSLAKGVLGSMQAWCEEGGNAQLKVVLQVLVQGCDYESYSMSELTMEKLPELLHEPAYIPMGAWHARAKVSHMRASIA